MKDLAIAAAKRLVPPVADAPPEQVQAWRWFVAVTVGANALGLAAHIALACGLLAGSTGYSGFASAADVETMKTERKVERVRELSKEMLDAKLKQCNAPQGEVRQLYLRSYNELRAEYFQLTKREFPDPPCSEF